ncbi:MAG: lactate utilization protein [Planctomycetes bacterium]|nr:lactate utilization protein [Planctomycetota bacterium]
MNTIKTKITNTLKQPFLRKALNSFASNYLEAREHALKELDFEKIRSEIATIKDNAINDLPGLIDSFTKNAKKNGAQIHHASNGQEAINYITELISRKNIKRIIKSKSMTSEEIHLNHALLKTDAEVTETDLGEWIIQLAKQKPSHMVMPAIHMTAAEVAELFTKVTGQKQSENISQLVKLARQELRKKFLEANLGIIGSNIAVADNGTLVVLTNEGNGRLVATLPKTVVALVGVEKLVPSFKEAAPIIKILPRNATGQLATSYVSLIRGPSPDQELHIILLDNGRLKLRHSDKYRTALRCLRCGACANVCPVYQQVGGHVFGHIYSGAIGLVLTRIYHGLDAAADLIRLCYKCQGCKTYCPAEIDIPQINIDLHHDLVRTKGQPLPEKISLKGILPNQTVFQGAVRTAQRIQSIALPGKKEICRLPGPLGIHTKSKTLPLLAPKFFRDKARDWIPAFAGMTRK